MTKDEHALKTTPTQDFVPAGLDVKDEVIAEHSAGIELEDAAVGDLAGALPLRAEGSVPGRTVADRMREYLGARG